MLPKFDRLPPVHGKQCAIDFTSKFDTFFSQAFLYVSDFSHRSVRQAKQLESKLRSELLKSNRKLPSFLDLELIHCPAAPATGAR